MAAGCHEHNPAKAKENSIKDWRKLKVFKPAILPAERVLPEAL